MRLTDDAFKEEIYRRKTQHDNRLAAVLGSVTLGVTVVCAVLIATIAFRGVPDGEMGGSPVLEGTASQESSSINIYTGGDSESDMGGSLLQPDSSSGGTESNRYPSAPEGRPSTDTGKPTVSDTGSSTDIGGDVSEEDGVRVMVNGYPMQEDSEDAALLLLSRYVSVPGYDAPTYEEEEDSPVTPPSTENSGPTADGSGNIGTSDGGPDFGFEIVIAVGEETFCYSLFARTLVSGDRVIKLTTEQASDLMKAFLGY